MGNNLWRAEGQFVLLPDGRSVAKVNGMPGDAELIVHAVNSLPELERAKRIMQRAISWLQIKEAAFTTAKGPGIIEEMQRFCGEQHGK